MHFFVFFLKLFKPSFLKSFTCDLNVVITLKPIKPTGNGHKLNKLTMRARHMTGVIDESQDEKSFPLIA